LEVDSEEGLIGAVREADQRGLPLLILAGGSNMLISDAGFRGRVIRVATKGITRSGTALTVAAGEPWDKLVAWSVEAGLSGLEMLSGIPGLVGAAPIQNIGAYGAEVANQITSIRVFDRVSGQVVSVSGDNARFGYRTSFFKQSGGRYVVLSLDLILEDSIESAPIEYVELARHLGVNLGDRAPATAARQAVLELRRGKGMVVDPQDHDTWSAGSFFTNPILTAEQAEALPTDAPRFPQDDGHIKTSAAWLIDHAGFPKGYGTGAARLSTKHVLAITNRGTATAHDILTLAREIRDQVQATYNVRLEAEPQLVGLTL
jgi:UDP-N-acetylmuramate dehydrogenase